MSNTAAATHLLARTHRPTRATLLGHVGAWDVYSRVNADGDQELMARHSTNGVDRPMPIFHARVMAGRKNGSEFWLAALRVLDTYTAVIPWERYENQRPKRTRHGRDHSGDMVFVKEHFRRRPGR